MGLHAYSSTQQSADGLALSRPVCTTRRSWLMVKSERGSPAAFFEMQKQAATFIGSFGGAVVVTDESTMVPVMTMEPQAIVNLTEKKSSRSVKARKHRSEAR